MSIASFYRRERWGSAYGVVDRYHPTPHKGLDVAQNMPGLEVPNIWAGVVVAVGASSSVGHYVTVRRDLDGLYVTYCHIVPYKILNTRVAAGQGLGYQARNKAEGGTAWTGPHTHLCLSRTVGGWATWTSNNLNPTSGLVAVLNGTSAAGGAGTPIQIPTQRGDIDMPELYGTQAPATIPPEYLALNSGLAPGKPTYMLIPAGAAIPRVTQDQNLVTQWCTQQYRSNTTDGIVPASWGWFDQMFRQSLNLYNAILASIGDGTIGTIGDGVFELSPASIEALADEIALEIDLYADGKKQS